MKLTATVFNDIAHCSIHYTTVIVQKNPDFGYQSYHIFDLENTNSADCKAEFRVEKVGLPRLADALRIPAVFHCKQRSICDGLCVLLRRTSYPYADSAI